LLEADKFNVRDAPLASCHEAGRIIAFSWTLQETRPIRKHYRAPR
jgi:hypothetical protein